MSANLIMFGEDWGAYPSSTQHLARALVSDRKILWVNSIGLRRPRFNRHDIERLGHKLVNAVRQLSNPVGGEARPPGLTVAAPLVLPFPGIRLAERTNRAILARLARSRAPSSSTSSRTAGPTRRGGARTRSST